MAAAPALAALGASLHAPSAAVLGLSVATGAAIEVRRHWPTRHRRLPRTISYAAVHRPPVPPGRLVVPVGMGHRGVVWTDLADLPHLLVGGTTGGGKSCFLSQLITSVVERYEPMHVLLTMIDLKRVELQRFSGLPHQWHPTNKDGVTLEGRMADSIDGAAAVLGMLRRELDRRFDVMRDEHVVNIEEFRALGRTMPRIICIVDEVAELMCKSVVKREEAKQQEAAMKLMEIARLGRACGIHLILCTQRPDANAVPGQLKANVTATVAFRALNSINAGILEAPGAQHLPKIPGRALWVHDGMQEVQAPWLSNAECKERLSNVRSSYARVS